MISQADEFVLGCIALTAMLAAAELGFRIARARAGGEDVRLREHASTVQSALMGVLALLLGFSFSMAVSRYDARRHLVVEEANAIGTAYLRSDLLDAEASSRSSRLYRSYVDARIVAFGAGSDARQIDRAISDAANIQFELWALGVAQARLDSASPSRALYLSALNEMIDVGEMRLRASRNHVPDLVVAMVLGLAVFTMGLVGFNSGLDGWRRFRSTALMSTLLAVVIAVVLDLDHPRRGLVRVDQVALESLRLQIEHQGQR